MRERKGGEGPMSTNMDLLRGKLKERSMTQKELAGKSAWILVLHRESLHPTA